MRCVPDHTTWYDVANDAKPQKANCEVVFPMVTSPPNVKKVISIALANWV